MQREAQDHYAKTATLALQIQHHGLPLHIALDWAGPTSHRAALAAFIGGDFFLARYSGNYFAKALLPSEPRHSSSLTALGTQASRVCLHCWHHLRALHEEDEAHVLFDCPAYQHQRRDFRKEITGACGAALTDHSSAMAKWVALLSSPRRQDWEALGRFLARSRQIRRKMRIAMTETNSKRIERSIERQKQLWRRSGKYVCRHGVFFESSVEISCPCLGPSAEADWSLAVLMPAIDDTLKTIVVDTFVVHEFRRLGQLQAELRRRGW
jgi:hypothetical protein